MASVTQKQFHAALAAGCPKGLHLLATEAIPKGERVIFPAHSWKGERLDGAWYWCVGASSEATRRRRPDIKRVRALVIDDVGTKVAAANITLPPSYIMETSKGNFQYGYLLDWSDDLAGFDALNDALADAGLQDKGAKGVNRVVRVPGSVNVKPGREAWQSVVRDWHPKRVFTLAQIAKALGVKPGKRAKAQLEVDRGTKGMDDPVYDWLTLRGMVRGAKSDGWVEIACPFAGEHGGDPRDEAAYKPIGADNRGTRGIKCFHSHGEVKGFSQRVLDWVAAEGGPQCSVSGVEERASATLAKLAACLPQAVGGAYTHATLLKALGDCPKSALVQQDVSEKGHSRIQPTTYVNVLSVLAHLGVDLRFNLMTHNLDYTLPERVDADSLRAVEGVNGDVRMLLAVISDVCSNCGMRNTRAYREAIVAIASSRNYHPMQDWIASAKWDGKDHLAGLLASVKSPTPELFAVYLRRWLLQGVEAVCGWRRPTPTQKAAVLVLVGKQGIGKTRWLASLAPQFSRSGAQLHLSGFGARDTMHESLTHALVELGELEITFGKSESGALKNFLSQATDKYRMPYAADWVEKVRCTSFCGSVNDPGFLVDASGSRRFWPVEVKRCEVEHGVHLQQLWAQMHALWAGGEQYWLTPKEDALREDAAEKFTQPDEVTETLNKAVHERRADADRYDINCGLNITDIHRMLRIGTDRRSLSLGTQVLSSLLERPRDLRDYGGGQRAWVWPSSSQEKDNLKLSVLKPGYRKV